MGQKTDQLFGQRHEPFDVSKGSIASVLRCPRYVRLAGNFGNPGLAVADVVLALKLGLDVGMRGCRAIRSLDTGLSRHAFVCPVSVRPFEP